MKTENFGRPAQILLVEDNPGDVRLTKEALKENKVRNNLSVEKLRVFLLDWRVLFREWKNQKFPKIHVSFFRTLESMTAPEKPVQHGYHYNAASSNTNKPV